MNELSRHIEILLLNNECVVVPGLGGFISHHIEAQYDIEAGAMYPPTRSVSFNSQLQSNDSTLVSSYVDAYDISFPEAQRRVDNDVEEIRQELAVCGSYIFHGIGELKLTSDGRYEFMPCEAGLLTPSLYAFPAVAVEVIEALDKRELVADAPATSACVTVELHQENERVDDSASHSHYVDRNLLRNALLAACMLLLFVFASLPLGHSTKSVQQSSIVGTEALVNFTKSHGGFVSGSVPQLDNAVVRDSTANNQLSIQTEDADSKKEKTSLVEKAKVVEKSVSAAMKKTAATSSSYFTIVLASKVSKIGAEDYVSSLKKSGYSDAYVFDQTGSVRKVVFGKFSDEASARRCLEELRDKNEQFAEAWIAKL